MTTARRVAARHWNFETQFQAEPDETTDPVQKETNAKKQRYAALRVAARFQRTAIEFPSPEALKQYLHDHPGADKSKHTVAKPGEGPAKEDAPKDDKPKADHEEHGEKKKPKTSWKDVVKGLSEKAKSFVTSAPKAVQSFVNDEAFRRKALMSAHAAISNAPKAFMARVVKEAKHEAKEFKDAGAGVMAVMKGGKMSHEQKHAVKTIATHLAITAAAVALGGGLAAGAAAMAKGTVTTFAAAMAKRVVLKAVVSPLGTLPTVEEFHHIGHGAWHLVEHAMHLAADDEKEMSPEDTLQAYIAFAVAKGIKELDAESMIKALEECAEAA